MGKRTLVGSMPPPPSRSGERFKYRGEIQGKHGMVSVADPPRRAGDRAQARPGTEPQVASTPPGVHPKRHHPAAERPAAHKKSRKAASERVRPPPGAPRFTEQHGMEHMLALSQQAVERQAKQDERQLERERASRAYKEHQAQVRASRRREGAEQATEKAPSRTAIMKQLQEAQREKTRARKEKRRSTGEPGNEAPREMPYEGRRAPKKRVAFA